MRLVSWLTCSMCLTLSWREKSMELGNDSVLLGSLYAESRRKGDRRDM